MLFYTLHMQKCIRKWPMGSMGNHWFELWEWLIIQTYHTIDVCYIVHVYVYYCRVPYLALAATFGEIEAISAR